MKFGKILCSVLAVLLLTATAPMTLAKTGAADALWKATNATPGQSATNPTPGQTATNPTPDQTPTDPTPAEELKLKKPTISLKTREAAIVVSYKAVDKAKTYEIEYSTSSTFKSSETKKTKKTSYDLIRLKGNAKYYVRVRAWNGKVHSSWSAVKSITVKPVNVKTVTNLKLTGKSRKIAVSFKAASGATAYEIQYATKQSALATAKPVKITKNTYTIDRLKAKTTYYVRIRSVKKVDGINYYSKWTTVTKVKTK